MADTNKLDLLGSLVWHLLMEHRDDMESGNPVALNVPTTLNEQNGEQIIVREIDGDEVKIQCDMDFVEGGNGYRYPRFIPKNEVWIDDRIDSRDYKFIALHEIVERYYMQMGHTYGHAHNIANSIEKVYRIGVKKMSVVQEEIQHA